jgi:hypothetical protein
VPCGVRHSTARRDDDMIKMSIDIELANPTNFYPRNFYPR